MYVIVYVLSNVYNIKFKTLANGDEYLAYFQSTVYICYQVLVQLQLKYCNVETFNICLPF